MSTMASVYVSPQDVGRMQVYNGFVYTLSISMGTVMGGLFVQIGWQYLFFVNVIFGVISLYVLRGVQESPKYVEKIDALGCV